MKSNCNAARRQMWLMLKSPEKVIQLITINTINIKKMISAISEIDREESDEM
jgi:hypothetical protein